MSISPAQTRALGSQTPTGFLCALKSESGPSLLLLPLYAVKVTNFLMSQVCCQAKGTESQSGSKNAGKYPLSNPKGKEELFLWKTSGCEENSPAASQGGASEFLCAKSGVLLGKDFYCNSHLIHVFFQPLFTVNYFFRLPISPVFFPPGNCFKALQR